MIPVDWNLVYEEIEKLLGRRVTSFTSILQDLWGSEDYWIVSKLVEQRELMSLSSLVTLDDSPRILRRLFGKYTLNIASLQSRRVIDKALSLIGVRELFKAVVSRDDKPTKGEQIRLMLSTENYRASETLMIGDRVNDAVSALENGCKAVLIVRRRAEAESLKRLRLDGEVLVLRSLDELYRSLRDGEEASSSEL